MIAFLQPFIPSYREEFFEGIANVEDIDIFCYLKDFKTKKENFHRSRSNSKFIRSISLGPFLVYDIFEIFGSGSDKLVLMLHIGHISTWIILLTKFIHRKEIILWGHGISVKRYMKEEKKPSQFIKAMISLSDGVWFYTEKEKALWSKHFPNKNLIALNNTISDLDTILKRKAIDKDILKEKYKIIQETVFIYCARFNESGRRIDLLLEVISRLDKYKYGFIIIGDGTLKPDFSIFENVFDFGSVYDREIKSELFEVADIYFQPGWVGLSIVEAMAYSKPVFTFRRNLQIPQCVEYHYIQDGINGKIFENTDELIKEINKIKSNEIKRLGNSAKELVEQKLTMNNMVKAAILSI